MADPEDTRTGIAAWFPAGKNNDQGWRLDVVTLLAVIGESAMIENAQALTATPFCLLPRIIPAPQALLKAVRPARLPSVKARMIGIYSGVNLDSVGFFADILHPLEEYAPFSFRVFKITHTDLGVTGIRGGSSGGSMHRHGDVDDAETGAGAGGLKGLLSRVYTTLRQDSKPDPQNGTRLETSEASSSTSTATTPNPTIRRTQPLPAPSNLESNPLPPQRSLTLSQKATDFLSNPTLSTVPHPRPAVPAKAFSPIHLLSIFSFLQTLLGLALCSYWRDGTAILSLSLLSFTSTVVGYASWWKPLLMKRSHTNLVPRGDVLIRTREGAFILIKCTEDVARELYSGTEECEYRVHERAYKFCMALGTTILMLAVVLLGNCEWNSQVYIGASYMLLNGLYWAMGMLPRRLFWDLGRYSCVDITPADAVNAHTTTDANDQREGQKSFTRTLWWAIRETGGRTSWCLKSGAAPDTPQWRMWLNLAGEAARKGDRGWRAVAMKDDLMRPKVKLLGGEVVENEENEEEEENEEKEYGTEGARGGRTG